MKNINISNFRKDLFHIIENTVKYNEPVCINTKAGDVVVVNKEEYENILASLKLISNKDVQKKIVKGMNVSEDEFITVEEVLGKDWDV